MQTVHRTAPPWLPQLVVSGGQTGVDRAALDWAIQLGIAHGGWCPRGRKAGDGTIPAQYQLKETDSEGYRHRTRRNVVDSDATLLLNMGTVDGGTLQTVRFAVQGAKPHLLLQVDTGSAEDCATAIQAWWVQGRNQAVNFAGPREEKRPGIYMASRLVLERVAGLADTGACQVRMDASARCNRSSSFASLRGDLKSSL